MEVVESRRDAGAGDSDFLFVDGSSQQCSAGAITATWNALAAGRITDDLGHPSDRPLTKHSARRAGAQLLIRRGRPLAEVQYMGRWGSQTVERYVAEATSFINIHGAKRGVSNAVLSQPSLWEIQDQLDKLKEVRDDVDWIKEKVRNKQAQFSPATYDPAFVEKLLKDSAITSDDLAKLPPYVLNLGSSTVHRCDWVRASFLCERTQWVTRCGFRYVASDFVHMEILPQGPVCRKLQCFGKSVTPGPVVIPQPEAGEGDTSDSTDSD